jgi:DNA modification methylase
MLVNADAGRIPLQDGVVHCSISSPPYFSLRQYTGDQGRDWPAVSYAPMPGLPALAVPPMRCALGLEPDVASFIGHLVLCYREVWRVLRDDGVVWVVIGDSFASQPQQDNYADPKAPRRTPENRCRTISMPAGNLLAVPYRLLLALQGDGWVIRNDCVWQKVAPMPESVAGWSWRRHRVKTGKRIPADWKKLPKGWDVGEGSHDSVAKGNYRKEGEREATTAEYIDCPGCPACSPHDGYVLRRGSWRHTRSHETVIMATKGMGYYADQEAVKEIPTAESLARISQTNFDNQTGGDKDYGKNGINRNRSARSALEGFAANPSRNPRDVLTPRPESYPGQHYATFPRSLVRPLILASCPARACPVCGAGWAPQIEHGVMQQHHGINKVAHLVRRRTGATSMFYSGQSQSTTVLAYRPTCEHDAEPAPGLVLDPFAGTGTVLVGARALGRRGVGCDLSYAYLSQQARARLELDALDDWHEGDGVTAAETADLGPLFGVHQ